MHCRTFGRGNADCLISVSFRAEESKNRRAVTLVSRLNWDFRATIHDVTAPAVARVAFKFRILFLVGRRAVMTL